MDSAASHSLGSNSSKNIMSLKTDQKAPSMAKRLHTSLKGLTKAQIMNNHFDDQNMKDFDLEKFEDSELEEELDYLSENELAHRQDEDNVFHMIRKAKQLK